MPTRKDEGLRRQVLACEYEGFQDPNTLRPGVEKPTPEEQA